MSSIVRFFRTYPAVAWTLLVGLVGVALVAVPDSGPTASRWVISVFALVVAAQHAWSMIQDIKRGIWGLDILAVTAILSTVVVGEYWAALVIVLMVTSGTALEDFAAGRAKRELTALLSKTPRLAHREATDGSVEDVPVEQVEIGDLLVIKPSEMVPVDAVLVSEAASIDESSLTGESLPVEHLAGDTLMSGSLNGSHAVRVRVSALAADSQYQQIVALVEEAAESRAPFVRLADRYAVPFTILAYIIAGIAWGISGDPVRFAEVLVVATPCPLLIAAPVAFIAGMSRAAKNGIIVKNGGTLEQLAKVRTVAFDKTGTLTHGTPEVARVLPAGRTADDLVALVASAEQFSTHVLAQALVAEATSRGLSVAANVTVEDVPGKGLRAQVDGQTVLVGSAAFIATSAQVDLLTLVDGEMSVCASVDGVFAGTITLSDQVRADSAETVTRLGRLGIVHTMMLTGDAEATAQAIAAQVGVSEVRAGCLPEDKVRAVAGVTEHPVLMVGDGINDAPVLAAADVGVAMGARGATAASESAAVVILVDEISRVADAVAIAQRTIRVALQSIAVGIGLSIILMVLAAFGVIPAIVGAGLQEVVDLITILNALRALSGDNPVRVNAARPTKKLDSHDHNRQVLPTA